MPPFSIFKAIRQIFARKSHTKVKSNRQLRLVQLEDRRMLNATFAFNGAAQLDLAGFTNTTATLTIGETGAAPDAELTFTLDAGTWSGTNVVGSITGNGTSVLTVEKSLFADNAADQLSININALIAGADNVNVLLGTDVTLPDSPIDGSLNITSDGTVTLGFAIDGAGNDLSVDTTGAISQTAALSNMDDLNYDAGTTIDINASIATLGTVDIDSTGLTTIGAAGDITAGGAVTFGAAKAGLLTTSGDIDTTDDNITFNRAVTLGGDVDFDTTGTAAGNIHFASTIATAGNNLTLDAGSAGDIDLDAAATGGGDLIVRDGAVQEYNVLTFDSVDILDATTSVTFHNAVTVSANNANGGSDALKVNTPGSVTIDGTVTATAIAGLNIDIDPVDINVNANMSANGDIDLTASNNISVGAFTVRADADGVGGGVLSITADDDTSGAGSLLAADGSTLRGNAVNLIGFDVTTDIVTADAGNLTITGANEVTLNDTTTATAAQVIVNADANDVNTNGTVNAATGVTLDAAGQNSDVIVNAAVTTAAGDVTIEADDSVRFAAAGDVTATGAGNVLVNANRVNTVGDDGDQIVMANGTIINGGSGTVTLTALGTNSGNITLGSVQTTNATAAAVVITTASGAIIDGGDTNVDIVANTAGARTTLTAADGIGAGNAIETTVAILDAHNTTTGSIEISETDGIQVQRILQDQDDSISLIAGGTLEVLASGTGVIIDDAANADGNSDILLRSTAASVLINQIVRNDSDNADADITLDAVGQNSDVVVNAAVTTAAGDITVQADDSVQFAAAGDVTATGAGNVLINANRVNTVGDDGDQILMADGTIINGGSGTVTLTALGTNGGNITIGSVQTTNATATAVVVTTDNGAILDGGDTGVDIIANSAGARTNLTAVTGIGSTNAIETNIASLRATNTIAGTIEIDELAAGGDIALLNVSNVTRDVVITANGSILDGNDSLLTADANAAQNQVVVANPLQYAIGDTVVLTDNDSPPETFTITNIAGNVLTLSANLANTFTLAQNAQVLGTNVIARNLTMTSTAGNIGAESSDVFKGIFDPVEVQLTGNLTATATAVTPGNGGVAVTGPVAGTTTITATTGYITSTADINATTLTLTVTNLALITTGTLTIADTGLIVDGDLRIEANDVDAVTAGNPVILGSAAARLNNLLYRVNNAADERVVAFTENAPIANIDVWTNSSVQIEVNGNAQLKDLDCDLTSVNTNNNTAVIISVGGAITQGNLTAQFRSHQQMTEFFHKISCCWGPDCSNSTTHKITLPTWRDLSLTPSLTAILTH
ncbi:MAG: hypothetical protein R3C17_16460 [Planctomycetaceae bacterium]